MAERFVAPQRRNPKPGTSGPQAAIRSGIFLMVQVAKKLQTRLPNVLTYFQHPITNAVSEGLNSKIQTIKKRAYGFRNRDHFQMAIYFRCGGLELCPGLG